MITLGSDRLATNRQQWTRDHNKESSESGDSNLQPQEFYGRYFKDTPVELEFCDSMEYKPKEGEEYDMVFIDGSHEIKNIVFDTIIAI